MIKGDFQTYYNETEKKKKFLQETLEELKLKVSVKNTNNNNENSFNLSNMLGWSIKTNKISFYLNQGKESTLLRNDKFTVLSIYWQFSLLDDNAVFACILLKSFEMGVFNHYYRR